MNDDNNNSHKRLKKICVTNQTNMMVKVLHFY